MAKPNPLISEQVRNAQVGADVSIDYNVQNIRQQGRAAQSILQSGQKVLDAQEQRKRTIAEVELKRLAKEADEVAAADMAEYTGMLSELKTNFDLAVSQTSDPDEVDRITKEHEAEVESYIANSDNLRNTLSHGAASRHYKQNGATLFKNAGTLRKSGIIKADTLAKLGRSRAQVKMNPMKDDKIFQEQLKNLYAQEVSMGVRTPQQAKAALEQDMRQKHRDQAVEVTAAFQTEMNQLNVDANTETARIWDLTTEGAGIEKATEEAVKMADMVDKRYLELSQDLTNRYKAEIKDLDITLPEERQLFQKLDADQSYRNGYRKSIKAQVDKARTKQQNLGMLAISQWRFENRGKIMPYSQLQKFIVEGSLPGTFVLQFAEAQRKQVESDILKAQKKVADTKEEAAKEMKKNFMVQIGKRQDEIVADQIRAELRGMNPDSSEVRFNNLLNTSALYITDSSLRSQVEKQITQRMDKEAYMKPINDFIDKNHKLLESLIMEQDLDLEGSGMLWDSDMSKSQLNASMYNIEQAARNVFMNKSEEEAVKFMRDSFTILEDSAKQDAFATKYIDDITLGKIPQLGAALKSEFMADPEKFLSKSKDEIYINRNGTVYIKNVKTGETRPMIPESSN